MTSGVDDNGYQVVFDILDQPYEWWLVPIFPGAVMLIALGMVVLADSRTTKTVGWAVGLTAAVAAVGMLFVSANQHYHARRAFLEGRYETVEGIVVDFQPDSPSGKDAERFSVRGQSFRLRPELLTPTFDQTVSRGGPDLDGRCVKIAFLGPSEILWLGIRQNGCSAEAEQEGVGQRR